MNKGLGTYRTREERKKDRQREGKDDNDKDLHMKLPGYTRIERKERKSGYVVIEQDEQGLRYRQREVINK